MALERVIPALEARAGGQQHASPLSLVTPKGPPNTPATTAHTPNS